MKSECRAECFLDSWLSARLSALCSAYAVLFASRSSRQVPAMLRGSTPSASSNPVLLISTISPEVGVEPTMVGFSRVTG